VMLWISGVFFFSHLLHNFLDLVHSYQKNVECDDDGQFYSTPWVMLLLGFTQRR
jgi:hypothetical protein